MRNILFSNFTYFRYERKFYVEGLTRQEMEVSIRLHPSMFTEIYHERSVNNIYFDSFRLGHYFDNLNGVSRRLKVRIRWYGKLFGFIECPTLEIKLKHNLHVGKLFYRLPPFTFNDNFSIDAMRTIFRKSSIQDVLKLHLSEMNFSLLNRYTRKYFLSAGQKYRITIDSGMQVYRLSPYRNTFLDSATDTNDVILELKYNKPDDEGAERITNLLPFRVTRSSKYMRGMQKVYI